MYVSCLIDNCHVCIESLREDATAPAKDDGQKAEDERVSASNATSDADQNSGRKRSDSKERSAGDLD